MEIKDMTSEQLKQTAKSLEIKCGPNAGDDLLREKIETALMQRQVKAEEQYRQKVQMQLKLKTDMAEIKYTATQAGIVLEYPEEPTIEDVVRLKKQLGMKIKEPKPFPETVAIRKSKRKFYRFINIDQPKQDKIMLVGDYVFHLFPNKKHCLPEWVVGMWEKRCVIPAYKEGIDPVTGAVIDVRDPASETPKFTFNFLGDAPDDHPFGICQ